MKIAKVAISNYRSIEHIEVDFPSYYAAISGKNDAGKTNVLRAIRFLLKEMDPYGYTDDDPPSVRNDYPNWKSAELKDRVISIQLVLDVYADADEGLYKFLSTYLSTGDGSNPLRLDLTAEYTQDNPHGSYRLNVNDGSFDALKAQEVAKRLQGAVLFHNSTEVEQHYRFRRQMGPLKELGISESDAEEVRRAVNAVDDAFGKIALTHEGNLTELLGKLSEKYKVGLKVPKFSIDYLPFSITVSVKQFTPSAGSRQAV